MSLSSVLGCSFVPGMRTEACSEARAALPRLRSGGWTALVCAPSAGTGADSGRGAWGFAPAPRPLLEEVDEGGLGGGAGLRAGRGNRGRDWSLHVWQFGRTRDRECSFQPPQTARTIHGAKEGTEKKRGTGETANEAAAKAAAGWGAQRGE